MKSYLMMLGVILCLSGLIYSSSFVIERMNNDKVNKLNKKIELLEEELKISNQKSEKLYKCLKDNGIVK